MDGSISISWGWGIGLISFAFGLGAGALLVFALSGNRRRTEELEQQLAEQQHRLDDYRGQVSQHFRQTSELVQKMTDSYRDVYEHLASGSQVLCQDPVATPQLDIPQKPMLNENPASEPVETPDAGDFSDAEIDPLSEPEADTLLGDAPNVPSLDDEPPITPRTPST